MNLTLICYRPNGFHFECTCGSCPPETSKSDFELLASDEPIDIAMLIASKKFEDALKTKEYENWQMRLLINGTDEFKKDSEEDILATEIYALAMAKMDDLQENHEEQIARDRLLEEQNERLMLQAEQLRTEEDEKALLNKLMKKYSN